MIPVGSPTAVECSRRLRLGRDRSGQPAPAARDRTCMVSGPVRRAVVQQAVVVGAGTFAPAAFGVVAGLLGQQGSLFRLEVDLALGVVVAFGFGFIQDV